MQKNLFSSWRPFLIVLLAAFLVFGCSEKADLGTNNPDPDPEPNPVVPLKSAVLTSDNIMGVVSAQVSEVFLMTYSPNGTKRIAVTGFGEQIATGTLVVNHPASMLDASGPYVIYGDSAAVYVAKRDASDGSYKTIFGLEAPTFGELFTHVAIDGVQIAIVAKRGPRSFFVRSFEIDYNASFIAGGARHLDNIAVLKTRAHIGRIFYGLEYGGKYSIESNELRVLGDRQVHGIDETPLVDFDLDNRGFLFTCSKTTAAMYSSFGQRSEIFSDGKDFRHISANPLGGVVHVQDGGFDLRVAVEGVRSERKKIHHVDPVPVIGVDALAGIGDVAVTTAGVWYLWPWDTGLAKASAADSTDTQPPPPVQWGMIQLQTSADFTMADLSKLRFTEAK